jgi:RNA polymerase sigma-70 factor (ECF subfamily)
MGDSRSHADKSVAFPVTDWQQLDDLKAEGGPAQHPVLGLLAERYWGPIFTFLVGQGYSEHEAEDLTQDFFAFALESRLFAKADRQRGRFRSFLLGSLKNFAAKARRRNETGKRCPPAGVGSLDALLEDGYYHPASLVHRDTPEVQFHRAWLHEVVSNVLRNLQEECEASGRRTHFDLFRVRVVAPELEGIDPPPLEEQARELGLEFKEAANQITTAKRAFKRILAREVQAYAMSEMDSREEVRDVLHFLRVDA